MPPLRSGGLGWVGVGWGKTPLSIGLKGKGLLVVSFKVMIARLSEATRRKLTEKAFSVLFSPGSFMTTEPCSTPSNLRVSTAGAVRSADA